MRMSEPRNNTYIYKKCEIKIRTNRENVEIKQIHGALLVRLTLTGFSLKCISSAETLRCFPDRNMMCLNINSWGVFCANTRLNKTSSRELHSSYSGRCIASETRLAQGHTHIRYRTRWWEYYSSLILKQKDKKKWSCRFLKSSNKNTTSLCKSQMLSLDLALRGQTTAEIYFLKMIWQISSGILAAFGQQRPAATKWGYADST